ncbi:G-protein-coupled receptor family protein [Cavenderia fasciculata]|uniref:G-protein-coupled receptor family protein n=1 Tax=Cavenderia fasciculata TaxID=261658 RepID=F4PIF1_CACFS|nr:G-protein-coupled receptor family protein [Cavenderia fasciculata]EGG25380.1 G-protein-coupled receptor family protein [Cavenderia fasciculata]|eukprot:XP_004363231.1 G-protein-coupled receptor family protein [Cavenderia fasciculata]
MISSSPRQSIMKKNILMLISATVFDVARILRTDSAAPKYQAIDLGATCQIYKGDLPDQPLCNGFLSNPSMLTSQLCITQKFKSITILTNYNLEDSIYINSTSTQESIQQFGLFVRSNLMIIGTDSCKVPSTFAFICAYLFPECIEYPDPNNSSRILALQQPACFDDCSETADVCGVGGLLPCSSSITYNNLTYPRFPTNATLYDLTPYGGSANYLVNCLDTSQIGSNSTVQKCDQPLIYYNSSDRQRDEDLGYQFTYGNSTCVVACPAPIYEYKIWKNLYTLSDILSILSMFLILFLIVTYGLINPKIKRFDKINLALMTSIFFHAFSGALQAFNGSEKTLCPEPNRFASHTDGVCVASAFILHVASLYVVQWWAVMSFEVLWAIREVGKGRKDPWWFYVVGTSIIAWVPPIASIVNNNYRGGAPNTFCWLSTHTYQVGAFWVPMGIFLGLGGLFMLGLMREIYIIISANLGATQRTRLDILKLEIKPILSLVMYFSILLYLFIYDQWIQAHKDEYKAEIPDWVNCLTNPQVVDKTTCVIGGPPIASLGYFIYCIRVFGIYAFLIYGISKKTVSIWKHNYIVLVISKKLEQMSLASTTQVTNSGVTGSTGFVSGASVVSESTQSQNPFPSAPTGRRNSNDSFSISHSDSDSDDIEMGTTFVEVHHLPQEEQESSDNQPDQQQSSD